MPCIQFNQPGIITRIGTTKRERELVQSKNDMIELNVLHTLQLVSPPKPSPHRLHQWDGKGLHGVLAKPHATKIQHTNQICSCHNHKKYASNHVTFNEKWLMSKFPVQVVGNQLCHTRDGLSCISDLSSIILQDLDHKCSSE